MSKNVDDLMSLPYKMRMVRKAKELSRSNAAERAQISETLWRQIEGGRQTINLREEHGQS